jgi:hypothetical protein
LTPVFACLTGRGIDENDVVVWTRGSGSTNIGVQRNREDRVTRKLGTGDHVTETLDRIFLPGATAADCPRIDGPNPQTKN